MKWKIGKPQILSCPLDLHHPVEEQKNLTYQKYPNSLVFKNNKLLKLSLSIFPYISDKDKGLIQDNLKFVETDI